MRTTGDILKEKRIEKNYSADRLAEELEVSQPYVTAIENNKKNPSKNFLKNIYKLLEFTEDEIDEINAFEEFRRLPEKVQKELARLKKQELESKNREHKNFSGGCFMDTLGIAVKKLREEKGYTQMQLSKKSGVASGTIGDIETGKNKSTVKTIDKIAKALELNPQEKLKLDEAFLGRDISVVSNIKDLLAITLKLLRESRNISMEELANKAGVSKGIIGEIERDKTRSTVKTLNKLATALNLTEDEKNRLDEAFLGRNISTITKNLNEDDFVEMPVKAKASEGNGYLNFEDTLYTKLIRRGNFCQDCYLIEVAGNSMEPLIQDGSFVIVDPHQVEYIANKIYVVKVGEETFVKRVLIKEEAEVMILKSINSDYEDVYIAGKELETVKLLGRAIKFVYEGNL